MYLKYEVKIGRLEDNYTFQPLEITNADKIDSEGIYNRNKKLGLSRVCSKRKPISHTAISEKCARQ